VSEKHVRQKAVQLYGFGNWRVRDLPSTFRGDDTDDGVTRLWGNFGYC
jgi:hypothetical protein